ncbi:hypothetical protein [Streptomyces sp. NRRL S-146]|uniref:hypothetical protein n=1 Tax=Streptomyces sp. NRRL S-146 TaxID=1463884 RepID=UPI0004C87267|nr:hypothetical protein [Streptomyces sp. NRRL S-146]
MAEQLSVAEVVRHLSDREGNQFLADAQYAAADADRRREIRRGVAEKVTALLVDGADGDLVDGAVSAEHLCNAMWHLAGLAAQEDELARTETEASGAGAR